jgi:hypothetical protein
MKNRTLTDEDIKAMFAESDKQLAKTNATIDRLTMDIEETKKLVAKTAKQADKTAERLDKTAERLDKTAERLDKTAERLDKTAEQLDKIAKHVDKIAEQVDKTTKQMEETTKQMAETDQKIAKIHKELGGIGENNGLIAEEIVFHSLEKNKIFAGIKFDYVEHGTVRSGTLPDGKDVTGEYDVVLKNGTSVAIIEVKHRVGSGALKRLIEVQLPRFKLVFPEYKDAKMYLGLGGMSFEKGIAEEARSLGIATLMLNGDAVEINDKDVKAW